MENVKISIIVPVYNVEKYIVECLESVVSQSLKEIEIILVDDCSSDKSSSICDEYAKKDRRVRVIHKEIREGAASARKSGIEIATGEFVGFVDSDDKIALDMYEVLYNLIVAHSADIVCCELGLWYVNKRINPNSDGCIITLDEKAALIALHKRQAVYPYLCNKLIKRELVEIRSSQEEIIVGEDYTVSLNAILRSKKVIHTRNVLYFYRQRKTSVCNNGFSDKYRDVLSNYRAVTNELCNKYPRDSDAFKIYCYVEELAIMMSMSKNNIFDVAMADNIKKNINNNLRLILSKKYVGMQYKISSIIVSSNAFLFYKLMSVYIQIRNKVNVLFD